MLADYVGIKIPVILLLNMMDVATAQKKSIDYAAMGRKLGIPVFPITAVDKKSYKPFYQAIGAVNKTAAVLNETSLLDRYSSEEHGAFKRILELLPSDGIGVYSAAWLAAKVIEQDGPAKEIIRATLDNEIAEQIISLGATVKNGVLFTGERKFEWIENLIGDCVQVEGGALKKHGLSRFDRIATSRRWGKPLALGIVLMGMILSIIVAFGLYGIFSPAIPLAGSIASRLLSGMNAPPIVITLICDVALGAVAFALYMSFFVFGVSLVFGFLEEVGYIARVSFAFDGAMAKLGLQGKAIMPFIMG
jgi:ferrous iron transport protein B